MYPKDYCPVCLKKTTKVVWDTQYKKGHYKYECREDPETHIYFYDSNNIVNLFYPKYWIATITDDNSYHHKIRSRLDMETLCQTDKPIPFLPSEEAVRFFIENYDIIK